MKLPYHIRQKWLSYLKKWRSWRKKSNLVFHRFQDELYDVEKVVHPFLRAFAVLISALAILSVIIPIGFHLEHDMQKINEGLEWFLIFGFIGHYGLRLFFSTHRLQFMKQRWLETLLVFSAFLIVIILGESFIGSVIYEDVERSISHTIFLRILKGYILLFVLAKILVHIPELFIRFRNTYQLLIISFVGIIIVGMLLLMLPGATVDGLGLNFVDALFTSTSAVCVTGLIVVDTATHFTFFGQMVIMVLIQLGGIGILTFATFLFIYLSGGLKTGQLIVLKGLVSEDNTDVVIRTLKGIVLYTLVIEAIGAIGFYLFWDTEFAGTGERIFFSVFHAVSAFCNAGFSVFTNSLSDAHNVTNIGVNFTTIILVILGGLGFTVLIELKQKAVGKAQKHRFTLHTKVVLITTSILLVFGTVAFLLLEWSNTLSSFAFGDKVLVSFFQSVTTRTAGFNTVDTGAHTLSITLIMLFLMFIGGSPASTAGGIKTTTFAILVRSLSMTLQGRDKMELFKRTIPTHIIFKSMTVILLSLVVIVVSTILLSYTEDQHLIDIFFEQISAFATVGLSRGITGELSDAGRIIITCSMFLGRVGILTFMASLTRRKSHKKYQYPESTLMVS